MALVLDGNGTMTVGNGDITGITSGAIESTAIGAGALLQRQVYFDSTQQIISSTSFVTVFTPLFTPKRSNSRIYLNINLHCQRRDGGELQFSHRFLRDGSAITQNLSVVAGGSNFDVTRFPGATDNAGGLHILYRGYDEPNTTSQITYTFQIVKTFASYSNIYLNFGSNTGATSVIIDEVAQ
jgi:hypothetical protein